ncbi:hypothetical protein IKE71_03745 [Candidatus Saccharibacteria bacterium]|nr:hypothetical protein [Candidatus Saccharibacteria bacterium]
MNYNEKKILTAKMTQNGVIEELKNALSGNVSDEEAFREWVANLAEVFTDAANDIAYHTKALATEETK